MKSFEEFIAGLSAGFTPVIDAHIEQKDYAPIDLSQDNPWLATLNISSSKAFSYHIDSFLKEKGKKAAFGGYNERRGLYRRSELFNPTEDEDLVRNIHLGLDIWVGEGTAVLAALDGKIHSFRDNAVFGDYGPTIILEHEEEGRKFYTLYGHLSRRSLEGLSKGREVKGGEKIAELGSADENGDYAAHLHFQIINDLGGREGDYPGVASFNELDFYLKNCPNPNLLLKIDQGL